MNRLRVVIVGGGVCGLGIGWKLAKAGADVTIFERDEITRSATWASAGMLAPHMELRPEEENVTGLGLECMARWPRFMDELESDAGISIDYRDEGILFAALGRDANEQLRFLHRHQDEIGLPVEWLTGNAAREREPYLSRHVTSALYSAGDHQVDARAFAQALMRAYANAGGTLREHVAVERILHDGQKVRGVRVAGDEIEADAVVLAAGAWASMIGDLPPDVIPPVRPIKGQMFAVQQPDPPILKHCLWAMDGKFFVYFAPKSNGRLLIGATVEEVGFDTQVTAGGMLDLLRLAWEALPALYDLPIVESWAGLRPGSRDNGPILGATPIDGLYLAAGHYRSGILFAPVTAEDVAHVVLTGETSDTIAPYGIERFATSSERVET